MKKLAIVLLLVLLICIPARAKSLSAWLWGDDESLGARVGYKLTDSVEAGVSFVWWPNDESPRVFGAYGVYHFPELVSFNNPLMLDFLPDNISGRPYLGAKVDLNRTSNSTFVSPIAGIVFQEVLFIEYQFRAFGDQNIEGADNIIFGLRIKF